MTIGEIVKQLLNWLYALWPLRVVHDWEQGVRCLFGNAQAPLTSKNGIFGTGLHCFWPGIGEIVVAETNIEVVETGLQTVNSADGHPVTFSIGVKYRIYDLRRMYTTIHDARETIYTELCSVAGWCVAQMEFHVVGDDLCEHILHETKEEMGDWGIELISLSLVNLNEAQPIRIIANQRQPAAELEAAA